MTFRLGANGSQQDLAGELRIAPSLVVLLDACFAVAAGLDRDLAGVLTGAEHDALARILQKLALAEGLPADG